MKVNLLPVPTTERSTLLSLPTRTLRRDGARCSDFVVDVVHLRSNRTANKHLKSLLRPRNATLSQFWTSRPSPLFPHKGMFLQPSQRLPRQPASVRPPHIFGSRMYCEQTRSNGPFTDHIHNGWGWTAGEHNCCRAPPCESMATRGAAD